MLLSTLPLTVILATVWPGENTVTFFLVVNIFSFVASAIVPSENAESVHLVVLPLAVVLALIGPAVHTLAFDVVVEEFTSVG